MPKPAAVSRPSYPVPSGMVISGAYVEGAEGVFTAEALELVADLARRFTARRNALLLEREERWKKLGEGALLDFLPETKSIREGDWQVAAIPSDLQDRRVEITGPVERK